MVVNKIIQTQLDEEALNVLRSNAQSIRRRIVEVLYRSGGGHFGGCLSLVDILVVLLRFHLSLSGSSFMETTRNRLILSKGHAALALYASMDSLGLLSVDLCSYGDNLTQLTRHPDMLRLPEMDFSSGSLGQGLSVGLGMAIAKPNKIVFVILGDGECQEGQVWEAAMLAAKLETVNLVAIVDCNSYQECGDRYAEVQQENGPVVNFRGKWRAFGWSVLECDGHSFTELNQSLNLCREEPACPTVILAKTIKGKGINSIESDPYRFHCTSIDEGEYKKIIQELK